MLETPIAFVDGTPKVQQIVDAFNQSIEQGEWAPGSKLPSVRELTETLGVSKFTLNEALDRLRGRNLLTSSRGRGFFVAMDTARPASAAWVDLLPQDLLSVLRRPLVSAGLEANGCNPCSFRSRLVYLKMSCSISSKLVFVGTGALGFRAEIAFSPRLSSA